MQLARDGKGHKKAIKRGNTQLPKVRERPEKPYLMPSLASQIGAAAK